MPSIERLRRDPGLALLLLALAVALALYAPTLGRALVNYDDPWLVRDNWIVRDASLEAVCTILFDTSRDTRAVLGAEYLPVRDLSVMLDTLLWGDAYAGFHLTNVLLYLLAIGLWFAALVELGIDRRICGLAILIWAVHPTHVESVAWLSERKGVLALALSGVVAFAHARFRAGRSARWLALALVAAVAAVWSKALAVFAIAALGGLELALPERRVSWRRSAVAAGALALVTAAAFVPVLIVASRMTVIDTVVPSPAGHGWLAMVLGVHGFYLRLAAMSTSNAVTYPINSAGPDSIDIALGAAGLVLAVAVVAGLRVRTWRPSTVMRAAALLWLIGWFPASRIVLPVRLVVAADRYLLFPTLGVALGVAAGVLALRQRRLATMLAVAVVLAGVARTLDAQANWRDARSLWAAAVDSNPRDGNAWSMYAEAYAGQGALEAAGQVIEQGLAHTSSPRLLLRRALLLARRGDRAGSRTWMRRAAEAGEPVAMTNLALFLAEDGESTAALEWARKAVAAAPLYVHGYRILGKLSLAERLYEDAHAAFVRAYHLDPRRLINRYHLGLALVALGRVEEARGHLIAAAADPELAANANAELARLPR